MAPSQADEPPKPASRAEAIAIIADARKIVTPNGVERLEKVAAAWFDTVEAPEKHLVWFEHSALVRFARPPRRPGAVST